eukprot:3391093-Prymnesium_polylepis.2
MRWVSPPCRNKQERLRANEREMQLSLMIATPPALAIALPSPHTVELAIKLLFANVNVPPSR